MFYCTTTWVYWFGSEERRLTPLSLIISYFWWWDNNDLFLGELSLLRRVLHNIQVVVMRFWYQKLSRKRRRSDKDYVEMQFLQLARHSTKRQRKRDFSLPVMDHQEMFFIKRNSAEKVIWWIVQKIDRSVRVDSFRQRFSRQLPDRVCYLPGY